MSFFQHFTGAHLAPKTGRNGQERTGTGRNGQERAGTGRNGQERAGMGRNGEGFTRAMG